MFKFPERLHSALTYLIRGVGVNVAPSAGNTENKLSAQAPASTLGKANSFQNRVCNVLLITLTVLGLPALAASLTRMTDIGWSSIMTMQCVALGVLTVVSVLRGRLSYGIRVSVLLLVMLGLGVVGLLNYGHLGGGKLLLLVYVVLTAMFAGAGWAYFSIGVGACLLLVIGWLFANGTLVSNADATTYQATFQTWLTAALTLVMLGGFIATGLSRILSYQRELLASLEKEASYTQALIQSTVTGLIVFDDKLQLESWNQHATPLLKSATGRKKMAGFTHLLLPMIGDVDLDSHLEQALKGIDSGNLEIGLRTPDSKIHYYVMSISPRVDKNENVTGVICVSQEVTQLKQSQQTLIYNAKLATLGEMTTSIAHEINQPLTALRLQINNLLRSTKQAGNSGVITDTGKLQKTLEKMDLQIERAAHITNHMRIVGRAHDDLNERFSIGECIGNTTLLLAEELQRLDIELAMNICAQRLEASGDTAQLGQALLQILQNAKDAVLEDTTPSPKKITIQLDSADQKAVIEISDNGVGISEDIRDQIFEPFFTTKEVGKGTGLGLSTSHSIIRSMGGTISVSAQPKGARFTITLPLAS